MKESQTGAALAFDFCPEPKCNGVWVQLDGTLFTEGEFRNISMCSECRSLCFTEEVGTPCAGCNNKQCRTVGHTTDCHR
jgi:hypothetical protein